MKTAFLKSKYNLFKYNLFDLSGDNFFANLIHDFIKKGYVKMNIYCACFCSF